MTDERERREFNAGLSEEVDAWLRGDTSRRDFLTKLALMGGAAMLPGLGYRRPARRHGRPPSPARSPPSRRSTIRSASVIASTWSCVT